MITPVLVDALVSSALPSILRKATRFAGEARVGDFAGTGDSLTTLVRAPGAEHPVAFWCERAARRSATAAAPLAGRA